MGLCLGARITAEKALPKVPDQNGAIELAGNMDTLSNVVPSTISPEGEILLFPKLNNFVFSDLKAATGNFHPDNLIGEGAFGCVYKGWIDRKALTATKPRIGTAVAVKTLNPKGAQGQQEWLAEIKNLGQLQHPNLVKLIGYCLESYHRLLVYEYMPNGSFENHLFEGDSNFEALSWDLRIKVLLGAAKGLEFLHQKANVVHRDLKTSDILLDSNFNAKISDFGFARDGPTGGRSHLTTRFVTTTYGYAAPEYIGTGHVSAKSDVYSFGVVLLQALSGKRAMDYRRPAGERSLVDWAKPLLNNKRRVFLLLDSRIADQLMPTALRATKLAMDCISTEKKLRPDMTEVVRELEEIHHAIGNPRSRAQR